MGYTLGIIGGSGLYDLEGMTDVSEVTVDTPYGSPSDAVIRGKLEDTTLLFMPRHGRGHRVPPHAINFRANVCAMKKLGATHLVSVSAVGSMLETIQPGNLVIPDQFIDMTRRRAGTFFLDEGIVCHVAFGDPTCSDLSSALASAADAATESVGIVHRGGTYVCIEGPAFSTRAESLLFRSWGVSVIGMTAMPEARLAREAELPYAVLALATDYDSWHVTAGDVNVEAVIATLKANVFLARRTLVKLAASLPDPTKSRAVGAATNGIMTHPDAVDENSRKRLDWLLGKR